MQVVILKQPLYGTVVWTGIDFIYTPKQGLSGVNDYYIYKEIVGGVSKTVTKYVNSQNTPPTANNLSLTADAFNINQYPITLLASDPTNTFNELNIISLSGAKYGNLYTDGKTLFYKSNGYKNVENLTFTVSDKQYTSTGTLTLSTINGTVVSTSAIGITTVFNIAQKTNTVYNLVRQWDSTTNVVQTYSANWESVDTSRLNGVSNNVQNNYQSWNDNYLHKPELDGFSSTVSNNSAAWNNYNLSGSDTYNYLFPYADSYNGLNVTVANNSPTWNLDVVKYTDLNNDYTSFKDLLNLLKTTVQNNSSNWDSTELNHLFSLYLSNWNSLSSLNKNKLDAANNNYNSLLVNLTSTSVSANSEELYNLLLSTSASWLIGDLNALSASSFNKWNGGSAYITNNQDRWSSTYNATTALSSSLTPKIPVYDGLTNTVNTKQSNWNFSNNVSSISSTALTGSSANDFYTNDLNVVNLLVSNGYVQVSGDITRFDTTYITSDEFDIYNTGTDTALEVGKVGGSGLIASFNNATSKVLGVETSKKAFINTLSGNSSALTVGGNISATGYIKPFLTDIITTYTAKSAAYENVYTSLSGASATTISNLTASKGKYDNLVNYQNLSASRINKLLTSDKGKYDQLYTVVKTQSSNNAFVNNYMALSAAYIDIDPEFVKNKPKYDELYAKYLLLL